VAEPAADDEAQAQADLAEATDRLSPAATAAIVVGVLLVLEHPEFPDLPVEEAMDLMRGLTRYPFILVTAVAEMAMHSSRWDKDLWTPEGVATGVSVGRKAGLRAMVNTAQHAAKVAKEHPPTPADVSALRGLLTGGTEAPPAVLKDYGGTDLAGQVTAHAILNAAPMAAAVEQGLTHKTWNSRQDRKVRPTHNVLDSHAWPEHTVPIDQTFTSPAGAKLMFPGDPNAPLDETANCRCWLTFTTPKRGKAYGEAADLATNPPEMQANPAKLNPI
jgi:hypothetical protein